ncbi:MAG TPA: anti-sigma factor [Thermoanaerobaculia bacterium]|nr:anti-sigma factor [Thermoanaerobaculia bacterium]
MSQELQSEDRTILVVLEALEKGTPLPALPPGQRDETAETLARLYTEVLGLLPSELTPVAPRPQVKARLLAQIAGDETQDVPPPVETAAGTVLQAAPPVGQFAAPVSPAPDTPATPETPETIPLPPIAGPAPAAPRPVPAPAPASPSGPVSGTYPAAPAGVTSFRPPARPERRTSRLPLALAAGLLLPLIGLVLWLGTLNMGQRDTIASLQRQLAEERQRASQAAARVEQASDAMHEMRANLRLVTQTAVEVSPLHPVTAGGTAPLQPDARGMLFVSPDHQHWYMSVEGLQPAGPGRNYQLWFVAGTRMVSGGVFTAQPGERSELSSKEMPADTKDVVITLEPAQGSPAPSGPEVLRAAAVYQII